MKWGIGLVAAIVISPFVFLAVKGIVGLALAMGLGLALVNFAPLVAMKFANWKIKGMKQEARGNPIETRENIALQVRERLRSAAGELTNFSAEVRNFADEVKELRRLQPDDAADFDEQLRKLQALLELKQRRLQQATAEADAFEQATQRAARKWRVAQSALRMQKLAGENEEDAMNKILASESLDAVQTAMNRALAELDSALAQTSMPQIERPTVPVIDVRAVEIRERLHQ